MPTIPPKMPQDAPRFRLLPRGIRARLFLLISLALLPMLLLLGWTYRGHDENRREQALQTELEVARGIAANFSSFIQSILRLEYSIGHALLALSPFTGEQAHRLLAFTTNQYPAVRHLSWVGPDGRVVASSDPANEGIDLAHAPYVIRIMGGAPWVLDDLRPQGITAERATLTLSVALRGEEGALLGILVASIEPTRLEELVHAEERPAGGAYGIFDRQGVLVYRSPEIPLTWEDRIAWKEGDRVLREAMQTGRAHVGVTAHPLLGGQWLSARVPIPESGWIAGAGIPAELVLAPLREQLHRDAALAILIASAAFLMAWLLARTISRPLERLEGDALSVENGRIPERLDREAPVEVHRLRHTVETMAAGLVRRTEEIRQSEERYRLVNLATNDVIWDWDLASGALLWNQAIERVFGYRTEEISRRIEWWSENIHPDDRERTVASLGKALETKEDSWREEYRFRRRDGSFATVYDRGIIHRDGSGKPVRMIGSLLDMTEHLRKEEALRAALESAEMERRRLQTVLEALPAGVGIADENGGIVLFNPALLRIWGGPPLPRSTGEYAAWRGRWPHTGEPLQPQEWAMARALQSGETIAGEVVEIERIDGEWAVIINAAAPIRDAEGRIVGGVVAEVDITAQARAEEEVRRLNAELERRVEERTAELRAANRELEAFTYSVSHDLRAPLRHVVGFVEMLGVNAGPALDEQGKRYVAIISEAARRMGVLIDDLLAFSRIGRAAMNILPVDLERLVEESRRELAPETEGRSVEWRIGSLPQVEADPVLLRTVLTNLLANALKYTRGRNPAVIEIGCSEDGAQVVCRVKDNGAGFDMRYVDKLFGVFQRLHKADDFEGTGIGLANVKRIIERHGGRVWAEGEVDRGATFFFSLPHGRDDTQGST